VTGAIAMVKDGRGRPLYAVRPNGMVVYWRYVDMAPDERQIILRFFDALGGDMKAEQSSRQDLEDFLDFKDDVKICG
jgi:hypothetical protein